MRAIIRRPLSLGFAAILAAAIFYAMLPQPVGVDIAAASRGQLVVSVNEDGKTRIKERYVVSAPLAGQLLRIELHPGDSVTAGRTILALIEPRDPQLLDARARAEAEARVSASGANLSRSQTAFQRAMVDYEYAGTERERARKLIEKGNISQQEFDRAAQQERRAAEDVESARHAVQIARHELELAQAALPLTRQVESDRRLEIRSPIDGRVLKVFQESSAVVAASQPILELGDPADLELVVDVLSNDGVQILPGAKALIERWGGEGVLQGRVRLVEPSAFTRISALGVEEQRVNVIIDFVDPPERRATLGDGFRVDARIVVWEGEDVLKIPMGALFREQQKWAVFKVVDGAARLTEVEIGRRNLAEAEVVSGLSEGDAVVLYPSDEIQDGIAVQPRS